MSRTALRGVWAITAHVRNVEDEPGQAPGRREPRAAITSMPEWAARSVSFASRFGDSAEAFTTSAWIPLRRSHWSFATLTDGTLPALTPSAQSLGCWDGAALLGGGAGGDDEGCEQPGDTRDQEQAPSVTPARECGSPHCMAPVL